jgi:hypothetical protein
MSAIRNLNLAKHVWFDELKKTTGHFVCRPKTLCNDRCETFHALNFDLRLKG